MEKVFQAELVGHPVRYAFHCPETARFFRAWLSPCDRPADIVATPDELAFAKTLVRENGPPGAVEFKALCAMTGRYLLRWNCGLFHAVAFLYRDRAWLLTAPSGTGKTTQFLNWRRICPAEITMISGDIPALERREDGIWVHPSPWNGKESIGSHHSAPLGGTVLLEQGRENRIERLPTRDAVKALFELLPFMPETEQEISATCRLVEGMLDRPVWKMVNRGDQASTELLRETLTGGKYGTL